MLNRLISIVGIASGIGFAIGAPALVIAHSKTKKEKGKEYSDSSEGFRDSLIVTAVATTMSLIAVNSICDGISDLKVH